MAYSAGIADAVVASYLGSILPLLMCADLQLQAEAVTLVGWLACSSSENACAIGSFDSFVSYVAILMGSTSARVQKQVFRAPHLALLQISSSIFFYARWDVSNQSHTCCQACWAMCAMSVGSNRGKITSVQV